jgi:hypothetical protein
MQSLNDFFESYAAALEQYDTKGMAFLYHIPCTIMSDEAISVFNDASKLEGFFNQGAIFYRQFGIAHARPEVWSKRQWSEKIVKVKVNWQYYKEDHQAVYNCDYHYVLKPDKYDHWKIVLSVSANEKQRIEAWQKNK